MFFLVFSYLICYNICMKIDDILKLIEADKKIDYSQLDTESLKIPEQAIKYHQLAHEESVHLRFLEKEYNVA